MSDINDFIIEDGVLTKYVGQGGGYFHRQPYKT